MGAVGTALGAMAGNLTVGRKKYAAVEEDIRAAVKRAEALQKRLLELVEEDAADSRRSLGRTRSPKTTPAADGSWKTPRRPPAGPRRR